MRALRLSLSWSFCFQMDGQSFPSSRSSFLSGFRARRECRERGGKKTIRNTVRKTILNTFAQFRMSQKEIQQVPGEHGGTKRMMLGPQTPTLIIILSNQGWWQAPLFLFCLWEVVLEGGWQKMRGRWFGSFLLGYFALQNRFSVTLWDKMKNHAPWSHPAWIMVKTWRTAKRRFNLFFLRSFFQLIVTPFPGRKKKKQGKNKGKTRQNKTNQGKSRLLDTKQ